MKKILVIEDDETILETLAYLLRNAGYETFCAPDGRTGLAKYAEAHVDLVLLDAMLPDISGFEVCKKLRQIDESAKVIMVTALGDKDNMIKGMDHGANDYVTKPFDIDVLMARIRSQLREPRRESTDESHASPGMLIVNDIAVDLRSHRVIVAGEEPSLTPKEFDLLCLLLNEPGKAFNRRELSQLIWHEDQLHNSRTVDAHVAHLRNKVESLSAYKFIETIHGFGYRCSFTKKPSNEVGG